MTTHSGPAFGTVLVANRGEIACRIIRTLRRLGIRSVAVYSDADRGAPHTLAADTAIRIGPAPASESYLNVAAIVAAAEQSGADAVHPGYGFVSESAALARACADAGIVFVGPGVDALELMGDKIRAKTRAGDDGVPVIPGSGGERLGDEGLIAASEAIGFPLIVKPSAGGGGKGMQIASTAEELPEAIAGARRVARAAFGDDSLLLERYLEHPRHIEVQILADTYGSVVHLCERECSLQRRHQKVIEEAPSPLLSADTRARMGEAACAVARSVGYVGAGTVEFLVTAEEPETFWFMEVNARLQVEHPVTEMVTGLDLVEWQLRIAAGEAIGFGQDEVQLCGHAIEARVYAEDPDREFLPSSGAVLAWRAPSGPGIRVDDGIAAGSNITTDYDPMLAKIIAHGDDRAQAIERLDRALAETTLLGIEHNVPFLRTLLADSEVRSGQLETGLIARLLADRIAAPPPEPVLVAAALVLHGRLPRDVAGVGWRLGAHRPVDIELRDVHGQQHRVRVAGAVASDGRTVGVADGPPSTAVIRVTAEELVLDWRGLQHRIDFAQAGPELWLGVGGASHRLRPLSRRELLSDSEAAGTTAGSEARSPMPGTVASVSVASGDTVVRGQTLATIEAMKMEHPIAAPQDGTVTITITVGGRVGLDQLVATVEVPQQGENEGAPA